MKIGIDAREIYKNKFSGTKTFLKTFVENSNKDDDLVFFCDQNTDQEWLSTYGRIIVCKSPLTIVYDQIILPFLVNRSKVDIFFSPYYKLPYFINCKSVITIHDIIFLSSWQQKSIKEKLKPYKLLLGFSVRKADKIITVSEYSKAQIESNFQRAVGKVKVVYNAVFAANDKKPKEKVIFTCLNFNEHKNFKRLIQAYAKSKSFKTHKLVAVVPDCELPSDFHDLIEKAEIDIRKSLDDKEMKVLYSIADLFVFPSLEEGFGIPPLEAMSSATAVCSSRVSCMPEILGDAADYFDPYSVSAIAESIDRVLMNEKYKGELIERGLEQVKKYSKEKFVDNLRSEILSV